MRAKSREKRDNSGELRAKGWGVIRLDLRTWKSGKRLLALEEK